MSTRIKVIKGVKEGGLPTNKFEPTIINTSMDITRFYGGAENGRMLQLTISNGDGYIQITKKQAEKLAKVLLEAFDNNIYPSE